MNHVFKDILGVLGILVLGTYAGCVPNNPSASTLSYISSSQQTGVASSRQITEGKPQQLATKNLVVSGSDGKETSLSVQVAKTFKEREVGLMYRENMADEEGMVFLFEREEPLNFWMKNTLIPLDMIYMDKDWKVVSIQKNAQPCRVDPCVLYPSGESAQYVLEMNGGLSDKLGIQRGAAVRLES